MKWGCKHEWKKVSEQVLPSAEEQLQSQKVESGKISSRRIVMPMWMFQKKFICILKCTKCPKIKKFVEVNP